MPNDVGFGTQGKGWAHMEKSTHNTRDFWPRVHVGVAETDCEARCTVRGPIGKQVEIPTHAATQRPGTMAACQVLKHGTFGVNRIVESGNKAMGDNQPGAHEPCFHKIVEAQSKKRRQLNPTCRNVAWLSDEGLCEREVGCEPTRPNSKAHARHRGTQGLARAKVSKKNHRRPQSRPHCVVPLAGPSAAFRLVQ